jgi:hypothetical protein
MFRRSKGARGVVAGAAGTASPYVDQLANDAKLRRRLVEGIAAGLAARQRAKQQVGVVGTARRLATDPVLRAHLSELTLQLQQARGQVRSNRSHKGRNALLFASGVGMVLAAVPSLRTKLVNKVKGGDGSSSDAWVAGGPTSVAPSSVSPETGTTETGT